MCNLLEIILVLVILSNQILLASSRLVYCIKLVAFQGVVLALIPIVLSGHSMAPYILCFTLFVLIIKGFVFPLILLKVLRAADVKREVEPIVGFIGSALLGIIMLIISFWAASKYADIGILPNHLILPVALYTILTGLFLIICRKKALMQVIGYLVIEDGIYVFGFAFVKEIPFLIEIGVFLDVFVAVFVMGIATYHISQEFETTDIDRLNRLRG